MEMVRIRVDAPLMSSFPLYQISMNVRWIPVPVTKTLIAPTVTVPTAALVSRDLLEMASLVQVCISLHGK